MNDFHVSSFASIYEVTPDNFFIHLYLVCLIADEEKWKIQFFILCRSTENNFLPLFRFFHCKQDSMMNVNVDSMSNCGKHSQTASTACPLPLSSTRKFSVVMEGKSERGTLPKWLITKIILSDYRQIYMEWSK